MVKTTPPGASADTTAATTSADSSKNPSVYYFHSVTVPQLVQESLISENNHLASSKVKNCKFELHVLYYHLKKDSKVTYVMKKRRLMIGKNSVKDISDGLDNVNCLTLKSMRTRSKEWVIDDAGVPRENGAGFSREKTLKAGSFLSKSFWQANLLWGASDSLEKNLFRTVQFIKAEIPALVVMPKQHKKIGSGQGSEKPHHYPSLTSSSFKKFPFQKKKTVSIVTVSPISTDTLAQQDSAMTH